jgi:hypothetical protein
LRARQRHAGGIEGGRADTLGPHIQAKPQWGRRVLGHNVAPRIAAADVVGQAHVERRPTPFIGRRSALDDHRQSVVNDVDIGPSAC